MTRDAQQSKLYRFEQTFVFPSDKNPVSRDGAQALINYVWQELGYLYPPTVECLSKNAKTVLARGSRHVIILPETTTSSIILHELAHSLTSLPDHLKYNDSIASHGPEYVGAYAMLLDRFLGIPLLMTFSRLQEAGIDFKVFGKAVFED